MATITTNMYVVQVQGAAGEWEDDRKFPYTDSGTQTVAQNAALAYMATVVGRGIRRKVELDDVTGNSITTDVVVQVRDDTTVSVAATKRRWRQLITVLSTYGDPDIRALVNAVKAACGWTS